jgi:hypothetical protein
MSTFKSSIMALIYAKDGVTLPPAHVVLHPAERWNCPGAGKQRRVKASHRRRQTYFRRCWWKMRVMSVAFGRGWSIDDARSQKRSEERLLDEQSWLRMDDEGCPNVSQQPYLGQEMIREKNPTLMKRRLMSLLFKVFVVPHPGGIGSICFACITRCVALRYVKKEKT